MIYKRTITITKTVFTCSECGHNMNTPKCPERCTNRACWKLATHPPGYKGKRGRPRIDTLPPLTEKYAAIVRAQDKPIDTLPQVRKFLALAERYIKKANDLRAKPF